ncbi:MAG: hypothetical protein KDA32_14595, partial [Phycisphaerales bacterium]|nr:hypothetical protein [Phycisphaerales bacterium]
MKRVISVAGIVLVLAQVALAQKAEPIQSGTASCVVAIWVDSDRMPITEDLLEAIIQSDGVAPRAARDILLAPDDLDVREAYGLGVENIGNTPRAPGQPTLMRIEITSYADARAPEMLRYVCLRLQEELERLDALHAETCLAQRAHSMEVVAQIEARIAELTKQSEDLRAQSGQLTLNTMRVSTLVNDAEGHLRDIEMDLAASKAKEQALVEQIKAVNSQAEATIEQELASMSQGVAKRMELLDRRAERVRQLVEAGQATPQELDQIAAERAEVAAHLEAMQSDIREKQAKAADKLVNKLRDLTIDSAAAQAQQAKLADTLAKARAQNLLGAAEQA